MNNEYDILLSYLKKESKKLPERVIKSFEDIPEENKHGTSDKNTEEYQEKPKNLDTPQISNKTVGFDVEKFENLMRSRLVDNFKKMQSYDRPYTSVTELFSCLRKTYYARMKYEIDLKKQFNFAYLDLINQIGNLVHSYIQEIYNFSETEKTIISEKYKVKGRIDALNENFLYEFKTLDEKKFRGMYLKEHYYQPIIYSYILNSEYNYNIDTITLVYIFRDNIKRKPYTIDLPIDNRIAISFLENSLKLQECISKKIVPEPINSDTDQCRWCSYISFCKKDSSKIDQPFNKKTKKIEKEIDLNLDTIDYKEPVFLL